MHPAQVRATVALMVWNRFELRRHWPWVYAGFWLAVLLLVCISELQAYHRGGGQQDWEPVLWELSSVPVVALLALALHRWVGWLRGRALLQQVAGHLLGASVFVSVHLSSMFGIRHAVYALLDENYWHDPLPGLLLYEVPKDLTSYTSLALISTGVWWFLTAQQRTQELERTRRELLEARLARLADQVQPHFLFNSLNLIASVMHEDVARADALLCNLSTLLRQTLTAQQQGEHLLADELALVQPYLALMQARFGAERLQVDVQADAAALACHLPALLLLGPVENAIKHDVAQHLGCVRVQVQARVAQGRLRIDIENDGQAPDLAAPPGSGLSNLRERLSARFGAAAHVELLARQPGTRLRIELPAA
jgi:two-component system, LytTR family, sensor kinase